MNHEEVLLSLIGLILYCVEVNIPFTYFVVNNYFNFFSVSFLAQLGALVRDSQRGEARWLCLLFMCLLCCANWTTLGTHEYLFDSGACLT